MLNKYARVSDIVGVWNDFSKIPEDILNNAADRGTRVHQYIDGTLCGLPPVEIDEDCKGYIESFHKFDSSNLHVLEIEKRYFDHENMITGCIDLVCKNDKGDVAIIDFKTSAKVSPAWALQLAGYKHLYMLETKKEPKELINVHLKKHGEKPEILHLGNIHRYDTLFYNALELYRYFNPIKNGGGF